MNVLTWLLACWEQLGVWNSLFFSVYSDGNNLYDANTTAGLSCIDSRCIGHNERLNIWHAGQHFIRLFLPLSAPASLEPHIQELLAAYAHPAAGGWDSARILGATQRLVARFVSGDYMVRPSTQPSSTSGTCSILNSAYSWWAKYSQTPIFYHCLFTAVCGGILMVAVYWVKGTTIAVQAWIDPEGSRRLRLPHFKTVSTWRW